MSLKPKTKPQAQRARKPAAANPPSSFYFQFLGFWDGWYALRADMTPTPSHRLEALEFNNSVVEWLISKQITPGKFSHIGNGNTGTGPYLPALMDGSAFCVLLKRAADVLRFEARFPCRGITPDAMLEALRAEAKVVRIGPVQIAQVAYDAYRKLNMIADQDRPTWEDASEADRLMFVDGVATQIEHPDWSSKQIHDFWMADREANGWTLGPKRDEIAKTHPSMVPFDRLSVMEQVKDELFRNIVAALLPLMEAHA